MRKRNKAGFITRRDALKLGVLGAGGISLIDPSNLFAAPVRRGPSAKSVIQIWMWGGPPHLDTFDPKPDAGRDYCGPLNKPIETNVKGIRIGQLLPRVARQADKYSIIRSMTHGINAHETASYRVQTGHEPGRLVYPSVGAVVSLFKGYNAGYKGIVPPYIGLTRPQGRFSEAGFLGAKYKPFATGGDPRQTPFVVDGIVAKGITDQRQKARRELLGKLDTLGNLMEGNEEFSRFEQCQDSAYELMFGKAKELFDLSNEKTELRERYGMTTFGQSCLMARRLVEEGVKYVTINYSGWDLHKQIFETLNRKMPELDNGMATLLEDLSDRGLLDSTIVWWGGEFGRGPKIGWEAPWNGGRSHYGKCFSSVLAGGGFKGGQVVGSSCEKGLEPKERPVYPEDMIRSLYSKLGIDSEAKMPNPRNLDVKVMPASKGGKMLTEIM